MKEYNSKKRTKILGLFEEKTLLTVKSIMSLIPNIDKATVYRNLNFFVEKGIIKEVHLHKEYSHYELNQEGDTHQHFICTNCNKVLDINVDFQLINNFLPKNIITMNFELNVKGICMNCIVS